MSSPRWLVLTWRLPAASSTGRVATWRSLRRLGAIILTPGAVIVPYSEHFLEQLEWIAEDVVQRGGDAYVLPVTELPEADEEQIRRRMSRERREEYAELRQAAEDLAGRLAKIDPRVVEPLDRFHFGRELAALQRRLAGAVGRDPFESTGRKDAQRAIDRAHSASLSIRPRAKQARKL